MEHAAVEQAIAYHERTKHTPRRCARGGSMDWDMQPDPFRHYIPTDDGATPVAAVQLALDDALPAGPSYDEALVANAAPSAAVDAKGIAQFLLDAFGLSAWKSSGRSRWSLGRGSSASVGARRCRGVCF